MEYAMSDTDGFKKALEMSMKTAKKENQTIKKRY
jgi:hypothetical protein